MRRIVHPLATGAITGHLASISVIAVAASAVAAFILGAVFWSPAAADMHDLSGGVFICHHPPDLLYSDPAPPEGWCQHYLDLHAIDDPAQQNPTILLSEPTVWYMLAAFPEEKVWCGTEFGFGSYDPFLYGFIDWGICAPDSCLELPTQGWPGPDEGTAFVRIIADWSGAIVPVYFFTGYAYGGAGQIPVGPDPATGFVGWGNCLLPPQNFAAVCLPALGLFTPGEACWPEFVTAACCIGEDCMVTTEDDCRLMGGEWLAGIPDCDPNPCLGGGVCCVGEECFVVLLEEICDDLGGDWHLEYEDCGPPNPCVYSRGVCCIGDECYLATEEECDAMGGLWRPELPNCNPNPCPYLDGVCCIGGECYLMTQAECDAIGGTWHVEWDSCDPNPCSIPPTVCCVCDDCYIVASEEECSAMDGDWYPEWDSCDPNPCSGPSPTRSASWGRIKDIFR